MNFVSKIEKTIAVADAHNHIANYASQRRDEARVALERIDSMIDAWKRIRDSADSILQPTATSSFVNDQLDLIEMACVAEESLVSAHRKKEHAQASLAAWENILAVADAHLDIALSAEQAIACSAHLFPTPPVDGKTLRQYRRCPNDDIDGRQCPSHPELYTNNPHRTGVPCHDLHFNPPKDEFQCCCVDNSLCVDNNTYRSFELTDKER